VGVKNSTNRYEDEPLGFFSKSVWPKKGFSSKNSVSIVPKKKVTIDIKKKSFSCMPVSWRLSIFLQAVILAVCPFPEFYLFATGTWI
jgi:hypothetical protein